MIVDTIWLTCKLEEQAKICLEYLKKWQKIQKNSQKNTKQNQLKIAKKWPKYHLDHENYAPIGATGKTPSWIPENIPKNVDKMAQNAIK